MRPRSSLIRRSLNAWPGLSYKPISITSPLRQPLRQPIGSWIDIPLSTTAIRTPATSVTNILCETRHLALFSSGSKAVAKITATKRASSNFDSYEKLLFPVLLVGVGATLHMLALPHAEREQAIRAKAFELGDGTVDSPKNFASLVDRSESVGGTLENKVIKNKSNGKVYLKKGASSRETLLLEYVISNALAMVRPGEQPECLILQDDIREDGSARFYTLSRMYPDTVDIQRFIEDGGLEHLKDGKKVEKLEVSLASDGLFAKQQDAKYANYIIRDHGSHYVVSSIDHEFAGERFLSLFNHQELTLDMNKLISYIRDLHPKQVDMPNIGMVGDPRAKAFIEMTKEDMDPEAVLDFYQAVANTDFNPLIARLELMSKHSDLVQRKDVVHYHKLLNKAQQKARDFVLEHSRSTAMTLA